MLGYEECECRPEGKAKGKLEVDGLVEGALEVEGTLEAEGQKVLVGAPTEVYRSKRESENN